MSAIGVEADVPDRADDGMCYPTGDLRIGHDPVSINCPSTVPPCEGHRQEAGLPNVPVEIFCGHTFGRGIEPELNSGAIGILEE